MRFRIVFVLAGLVIFLVLAVGAIQLFWPVLFVIFVIWLFSKALK